MYWYCIITDSQIIHIHALGWYDYSSYEAHALSAVRHYYCRWYSVGARHRTTIADMVLRNGHIDTGNMTGSVPEPRQLLDKLLRVPGRMQQLTSPTGQCVRSQGLLSQKDSRSGSCSLAGLRYMVSILCLRPPAVTSTYYNARGTSSPTAQLKVFVG